MIANLPSNSLILLVGISSSGKSTFAHNHFDSCEILSSDKLREVVSNDENDQTATNDAFNLLENILEARLKRGLITVIDATNLKPHFRYNYINIAKKYHFKTTAVVFDLPYDESLDRLLKRDDRDGMDNVPLERQYRTFTKHLEGINKEGFTSVHFLKSNEEVQNFEFDFYELKCTYHQYNNKPYWLISNLNGCYDEFYNLLTNELGFKIKINEDSNIKYEILNADEVQPICLLGDLLYGGDKPLETMNLILSLWKQNLLIATLSGNDYNVKKLLANKKINLDINLQNIKNIFSQLNQDEINTILAFFEECNDHYILHEGEVVVSYSGIYETMIGRNAESVYKQSVLGNDGNTWFLNYKGTALNVYGNYITENNSVNNNTININGNCVNGYKLIAFNSLTKEIKSVNSTKEKIIYDKKENLYLLPNINDYVKEMNLDSKWSNESIKLSANKTDEGMEFISKYSINHKALIYLPPTIPPVPSSKLEDFIEHPNEGFDYYRENGIKKVICQLKHMGSRGLILIGKNEQIMKSKFNLDGLGEIWSRTGRQLFNDEWRNYLLNKFKEIIDKSGLWDKLDTEWILFDGEVLPWSIKSQYLLNHEYAPVSTTANAFFDMSIQSLMDGGEKTNELLTKFQRRKVELDKYADVYMNYADINEIENVKFAPFHILAHEGNNNMNNDHLWHMNNISLLYNNSFIIETKYKVIDLMNLEEMDECCKWWFELTENQGYEGIVMKPLEFIKRNEQRLIQPALKVRGRSYLKMVYGPEYNLSENLEHHKKRNLGLKRKMATEQFIAGYESIDRFVNGNPFEDWFKAVFITYCLASEKTDARL